MKDNICYRDETGEKRLGNLVLIDFGEYCDGCFKSFEVACDKIVLYLRDREFALINGFANSSREHWLDP